MSGQHAFFAPSGAPVWGYCSAYPLVMQACPQFDTQATLEGTAAHWVVSEVLYSAKKCGTLDVAGTLGTYLGVTAPNGVVIDREIIDGTAVMVRDVLDVCRQYGASPASLLIEYRVTALTVHPSSCWGTLDVALDLRALDTPLVVLWDYKHGHGQVDALDNLQLVTYLEGLRNSWGVTGYEDQRIEYMFRVVQPRCYRDGGPVDIANGLWSDLRPLVNQLSHQAIEATQGGKMCPGKHCRYCPAIVRCSAARKLSYHVIDWLREPYATESMSDEDAALERDILATGSVVLEARRSALNDELIHRIRGGSTGTGLVLEAGKGRSNWAVPVAQVVALGTQFGVNLAKEAALTPTQATALVPATMRGYFKQATAAMTTRKPTGLKLKPASESRTARAFQTKEE